MFKPWPTHSRLFISLNAIFCRLTFPGLHSGLVIPPCTVIYTTLEQTLTDFSNIFFLCYSWSCDSVCMLNGQEFSDGQTWTLSSNHCSTCICKAGEVHCAVPECPKLACVHQVTDPGACCPRCRGCVYAGEEHTEGSSWFADSTPCMTCMCVDGVTTCSEVHCLSPCVNFISVPGECCPMCAGKHICLTFSYFCFSAVSPTGEIPRAQRRAREDVEGEGNGGPRGNRSTRCGDSQARRVAPADPGNNIGDLCPEERSPGNS
uniref:VWFC domain-containing protein n=1 Tax=Maylandia zebra TaxID=106582 RepID=A0A3P9CXT3_9CICH